MLGLRDQACSERVKQNEGRRIRTATKVLYLLGIYINYSNNSKIYWAFVSFREVDFFAVIEKVTRKLVTPRSGTHISQVCQPRRFDNSISEGPTESSRFSSYKTSKLGWQKAFSHFAWFGEHPMRDLSKISYLRLILSLIIAVIFCATAVGQFEKGTINGSVTDASGAVVVGAEVKATHQHQRSSHCLNQRRRDLHHQQSDSRHV